MKYRHIIFIFLCLFTFNAFAEDKAAKEDTTPPPMEGPLKPEQIPPIASLPQGEVPKTS
ncbi:MAG TPA: hypothetical protein VHM20_03720 [Gammaproteobacteria bacterium]|jgi:hypothetical protein|nr:hypothetical protein [Gammaproteobacteria bacterium]